MKLTILNRLGPAQFLYNPSFFFTITCEKNRVLLFNLNSPLFPCDWRRKRTKRIGNTLNCKFIYYCTRYTGTEKMWVLLLICCSWHILTLAITWNFDFARKIELCIMNGIVFWVTFISINYLVYSWTPPLLRSIYLF